MGVRGWGHARRLASGWAWLALALLAASCRNAPAGPEPPTEPSPDDLIRQRFGLQALGEAPHPTNNPRFGPRIALGRLLFFDPILAGERDVSCGACHHPSFGFADGRPFSAGAGGNGLGPARTVSVSRLTGLPIGPEPRGAPTILNTGLSADESGGPSPLGFLFWDGRARGLEAQAREPLASRVEMAGDAYPAALARDSVIARLRGNAEYVRLFREAFPAEAGGLPGPEIISLDRYGRAIAAYERELVTRDAPFDRYARGEDGALTAQQKRGLELFFTKARCSTCHVGPMFSDFRFKVIGVPQTGVGMNGVFPGDDSGREEATRNAADRWAFRTASLRNVQLTAPYMHDGLFATLADVVRFYNAGARPRHAAVNDGLLDPALRTPMGLTDEETNDLVAFLAALTDPGTALDPTLLTVPSSVPSGLTPVFGVETR